jgi:hypothetical protein
LNTTLSIKQPVISLAAAMWTLCSAFSAEAAILDTATNPANGHTYYLLDNSSWTTAENTAISLGGHLVTINDLAENNWVWDRWGTNRSLWIGLYDPVGGAPTFGWASGSLSGYRNWRAGEPNGDNYAYILAKGFQPPGQWNDSNDSSTISGEPPPYGVVEIEVCTPHAAAATPILVGQFVVGATITDSGCGYTNSPQVTIQGGGGSGATATAFVTNGTVTAINVMSAGSGYTSAPEIIIASPPFVPTIAIGIGKIKVTQHVMLGFNYLLQSSTNMIDWIPTGSPFAATNEFMTAEFDVDFSARYFRIQQVP